MKRYPYLVPDATMLRFQDELMGELEELEQEEIDSQLLNIEEPGTLPSVPSASVPAAPAKSKGMFKVGLVCMMLVQVLTDSISNEDNIAFVHIIGVIPYMLCHIFTLLGV